MESIIKRLEEYITWVLDAPSAFLSWPEEASLPPFLRASYDFCQMDLLQAQCLLMLAKSDAHVSPAAIRKHKERLEGQWSGKMVIFVQESISSYNRMRLIQHRVPFIVPGSQMYLPGLGLDLRERTKQSRTPEISKEKLSPSAQVVLLYCLLHEPLRNYSIGDLQQKLGYSRMTLTRVFTELEAHQIGETFCAKRERIWSFDGTKHALWKQSKLYFRTPIKRRLWVKNRALSILSGESALAEYTHLSPPKLPTFVLSKIEDQPLKVADIDIVPISDGADAALEIWHYDPALLAVGGIVDKLSLYLTFESESDERVQQALDTMMESVKWWSV